MMKKVLNTVLGRHFYQWLLVCFVVLSSAMTCKNLAQMQKYVA